MPFHNTPADNRQGRSVKNPHLEGTQSSYLKASPSNYLPQSFRTDVGSGMCDLAPLSSTSQRGGEIVLSHMNHGAHASARRCTVGDPPSGVIILLSLC